MANVRLCVKPGVVAGVTERLWNVENIVKLLEEKESKLPE